MTGAWGAETWSDLGDANGGFFYDAQASGADIADVASRVGDAFDGANCATARGGELRQPEPVRRRRRHPPNTDAIADANTLTPRAWPSRWTAAEGGAADLIAARGDVSPSSSPSTNRSTRTTRTRTTRTRRRIAPAQVYYDTVTYSLVVGTTIPATDGRLRLTIGPVSDVVDARRRTRSPRRLRRRRDRDDPVGPRHRRDQLDVPNGWGTACRVTESDNALGIVGPGHAFALTIKAATAMAVAGDGGGRRGFGRHVPDRRCPGTNPDNGVADAMLTVTRTVPVGDGTGRTAAWRGASRHGDDVLERRGACPGAGGPVPAAARVVRRRRDGVGTPRFRRPHAARDHVPSIASSANPGSARWFAARRRR